MNKIIALSFKELMGMTFGKGRENDVLYEELKKRDIYWNCSGKCND